MISAGVRACPRGPSSESESARRGDWEARIIDVGCGTSLLVDRLLDRGYRRLALVDVSEHALNQVHCRLGELSQYVEWHATDLLEFSPASPFDVWHDRAVLHFWSCPGLVDSYSACVRKPGLV